MVPAGFFVGFALTALIASALLLRAYWKADRERRELCEGITAVLYGASQLADALEGLVKARREETYCFCGVCSRIDVTTVEVGDEEE